MRGRHRKLGGMNNKLCVHRHTQHFSKSSAHRCEKRVESKVRQDGKAECRKGVSGA